MITSTTSPLKLCHSLSKIREDHMTKWVPRNGHVGYSKNLNANDRILFGVLIDCFFPFFRFRFLFLFFSGGWVGG